MVKEKTFIAIKSEAIQRHLIGEIIGRFERRGLKLVAMKLTVATKEIIGKHYPDDDTWYIPTGLKTIEGYKQRGIKVNKSPKEVAKIIREQLIDYFSDRPLICQVWEGAHAVQIGRKTVGSTNPLEAAPGTIRGDLTVDSYELADAHNRNVRTLVHASGSVKEAEEEIKLWFSDKEIIDYDMVSSKILYEDDWGRVRK
jgi:nucleoside-diphosphate kinase